MIEMVRPTAAVLLLILILVVIILLGEEGRLLAVGRNHRMG
jgi:hypothetical protein